MKQTMMACFLVLLLATVGFSQTGARKTKALPGARRGDVAEQLKKLEEEWANALIKRDEAALERILADDYVIIDPGGSTAGKAESIGDVKIFA